MVWCIHFQLNQDHYQLINYWSCDSLKFLIKKNKVDVVWAKVNGKIFLKSPFKLCVQPLTIGVSRTDWLSRSLLIRVLGVGRLRIRRLREGSRAKPWGCLGVSWLPIASCWWVGSHRSLVVVGRGHGKTLLWGSIDTILEWVGFTRHGESILVLRHGVAEGSVGS